jgi:release factor glutamine methyltransferase
MNENLPLKTPAISSWLHDATRQLTAAGIDSAKLDAEIILSHTLQHARTYLHAHGDELLTPRQHEIANARLQLRIERTPIAYIIGHKEFYGHMFKVTPSTLIPRPESEAIIELLLEADKQAHLPLRPNRRLVDVGTGSGCLGISAKLALPDLDVTLVDVSRHALNVAEENAHGLKADVHTLQSNLLAKYPFTAQYIIANLPYVDPVWERSPETKYEPELALFAEQEGLALIYRLLDQTPDHLATGGHLFIEADPRQHQAITQAAKRQGLTLAKARGFILDLVKS